MLKWEFAEALYPPSWHHLAAAKRFNTSCDLKRSGQSLGYGSMNTSDHFMCL